MFPTMPGKPVANAQANGQAINTGSLLSGLTRDSQNKPNTGTATGDRAVQDFTRGQLYQKQAKMARAADTQNAQTQGQQQMQKEAMTQQMRQAHIQRYQQMNQQATDQAQLGMNLRQQSYDLWLERMRGLGSLLQ